MGDQQVKISDLPHIYEGMKEYYANIAQASGGTGDDVTIYFMQALQKPGEQLELQVKCAITMPKGQALALGEMLISMLKPKLDIIPGGVDSDKMN